jgi:fructosamine-3-kinase
MLSLFGSPGPAFLPAYEEVAPLADGHEDRVALWQIMPLLAHAALFGGGYGASAVAAMRRYVC